MGVFIDYKLGAEGPEDEIRRRLEAVRRRCLDLPLHTVGEVVRMEPIYNAMILRLFQSQGNVLPPAVAERTRPVEDDLNYLQNMLSFGILLGARLPKDKRDRFFAPLLELLDRKDLWKSEDLPEQIEESALGFTTLTVQRLGVEFEFASALLCYGHVLNIYPGEGSESVNLGLCTFRYPDGWASDDPQIWYGDSFTKTQYAKNFIHVHETVCRVLDIVREEGLLTEGSDTCGYYDSRSWKEAGEVVNEELEFAQAVGGMFDAGLGDLREEGVSIQVVKNNAARARPVDFSSALEREEEAEGSEVPPQ